MKRTIDTAILWPLGGIALGVALAFAAPNPYKWPAKETDQLTGAVTNYGETVTNPIHAFKAIPNSSICLHEWVKGPFWIKATISWEEPEYYAPQGLINIEHCVQCGLLRLPSDLKSKRSKNLRDGPAIWTTWTNSLSGTSLTNLFRAGDGLVATNTGSNVLIIATNR